MIESIESWTELPSTLSGFRLKRLEVYNWGTFDKNVWRLELQGKSGLLTGDIGSGKSTLVDAITILLVPPQRVAFNKAAGADFKERSLRSYVLGYHRSERNESTGSTKPVGLRDASNYSVILGIFNNEELNQSASLGVVFWMKEPQGQPERFFVASEEELSVEHHFSNFGADMNQLRKRLRKNTAEIWDSFPPYCAWFRRRFGIDNEQALDLFHQTVSMKSVGNLTEFVRSHMLEPFETATRIAALIEHFDDLNRAHEAVLKAKKQITLLTPLVADCDKHDELITEAVKMRETRDFLRSYFSKLKLDLLEKRITHLDEEHSCQLRLIEKNEEQLVSLRAEQGNLRRQIADNGGDRLERLESEVQLLIIDRNHRKTKAEHYISLVNVLGEPPQNDAQFQEYLKRLSIMLEESRDQEAKLQNCLTEDGVKLAQEKMQCDTLENEIRSLKNRPSNIPLDQIKIRTALCQGLSISEEVLPFAGELIQVRESEREWEGAAERLLRNFGLSLLVPDIHYQAVSEWVDRTHLRGRIVYFRLRTDKRTVKNDLHPDSLVHKLSIKSDSPHCNWVENEIRRFDFACCDSFDQFRRETRAITRSGQIKSSESRHEKDDRHFLNDRSRYVLGWSSAAKISALDNAKRQIEDKMIVIMKRIQSAESERRAIQDRIGTLRELNGFRDYQEIDWQTPATKIENLKNEIDALRSSSDILHDLTLKLEEAQTKEKEVDETLKVKRTEMGGIEERQKAALDLYQKTLPFISNEPPEVLQSRYEELESIRNEAIGEHRLTIESCDNREHETREWLQGRIDSKDKKISELRDKIIKSMTSYKDEFKIETEELDASIKSADEFRAMLYALKNDDLPRFESRFKEALNTNTIREIANFSVQLNRERETIRERIDSINSSLSEIDYNAGRFIRLEANAALDLDIRDFQSDLRSCTEGSLTGSDDEQYSEAKFLQVRQIIDRFKGREGQSEQDRRWTEKVTDVRYWFTFSASERWREDDKEHEHYTDSGGKSGGQKEKLAYTILAASLAYQFGLEWGKSRSRSFRFVVIDEAFGRGSDESTQYGLKLFEKLHLQFLIVTPLQKIHTIEPFVSSVGFVYNEQGCCSKIRNLSIESYKAEKDKHQK